MNLRAEFRTPRAARLVSVHLGKLHSIAHVFPAALREWQRNVTIC
jgi:hypothetical protein